MAGAKVIAFRAGRDRTAAGRLRDRAGGGSNSYLLEADELTGPWRMVCYLKDFGEQAYFLKLPSKFLATDGRTMWLCYSANFSNGWNGRKLVLNPPGGRYGLSLHEVEILTPAAKHE